MKSVWNDQLLAAWEIERGRLLDDHPEVSARLDLYKTLNWQESLPAERGMALVAMIEKRDLGSPKDRRLARKRREEIIEASALLIAEGEEVIAPEKLPALLAIVENESFTAQLGRARGPAEALRIGRRLLKGLSAQQCARFLFEIGYPIAQVNAAKSRWIERLGLIPTNQKKPDDSLLVFDELAKRTAMHLGELDILIDVYTTQGPCGKNPECSRCAFEVRCPTARALKTLPRTEEKPPQRNLQSSFLEEDLPREKLARMGAEALTPAELLAILLRTGTQKDHVLSVATQILQRAGSLDRLVHMSLEELKGVAGLGPVKAVTIKAALELARRISKQAPDLDAPVSSARAVFDRYRGRMLGLEKERFYCLTLDIKNKVKREILISEGTLNASLVHPREAFKEALRDSAASVIFFHNHPSGDPSPSREDIAITRRLIDAGNILGIKVLDHIIIGRDRFYSFTDEGTFQG